MLEKKKYNSWTELIHSAYAYGMANALPEAVEQSVEMTANDMRDSFLRGSNPPEVRPSGGINCAGMTQLLARGAVNERPDIDHARALFCVGHYLHNIMYMALRSALPHEDFNVIVEEEVALPEWWPSDHPRFRGKGHIDLQLECTAMDDWFIQGVKPSIVADIKTKHTRGITQIKDVIEPETDVFGNLDQLAVYSDNQGTLANGALLIFMNREVPKTPNRLKVKPVFAGELEEALANVKRRVGLAVDPAAPFTPELWQRKEDGFTGFVPCKGYCDVQAQCERLRSGEDSWDV